VSITCPPGCGTGAAVWGTDVYTDDSSVCTAAGHAGVVDLARGGAANLTVLAGERSYVGTSRHGVTTRNWGSWGRSFGFAPMAPAPVGAGGVAIGCATPATELGLEIGGVLTVGCPGGCPADAPVWGTDAYAGDSSVCRAAVHAGLVDAARGGPVTLTLDMGRTGYGASERNGVASLGRALYAVGGTRSFTLAAAAATGAVTGPQVGRGRDGRRGQRPGRHPHHGLRRGHRRPGRGRPAHDGGRDRHGGVQRRAGDRDPGAAERLRGGRGHLPAGPDALALEQSVAITFPIPDGVDPADVVGLTTFDPAEGAWVVVPAASTRSPGP
jgi:hypothetical protein